MGDYTVLVKQIPLLFFYDHNILSRHTACDRQTGSTPFAKSGIANLQNGLMNFNLCSRPLVWRRHHYVFNYIMVPCFYNTKSPYCSVRMNSATGKKRVYTVNEAGVFCRSLTEGEKKSECHPYTNDTRVTKMSLPVRLPYAHRVVRRFRKELPGAPSPRDYRGEAASSHATSWGL